MIKVTNSLARHTLSSFNNIIQGPQYVLMSSSNCCVNMNIYSPVYFNKTVKKKQQVLHIVNRVGKKAWHSGRVADCSPVGRRFAPRMLLLTLSCSVELVRHCEKFRKSSIFIVKFSAFDTFLLCRTSSTL